MKRLLLIYNKSINAASDHILSQLLEHVHLQDLGKNRSSYTESKEFKFMSSSTAQSALEILENRFGYKSFREQQQEVIADVVANKDCFVLMPTGGGKSLCFQIPALLREGTAIVVSPLIALMQDQVDSLKSNGVRAEYYNSSLDYDSAEQVLRQLHLGELDLLYVSPERLMNESFKQQLFGLQISLFAIDEAHCISQWGHDFRPEYANIGQLRQEFSSVPFIALTATADHATRKDILQRLQLVDPQVHVSSFDRPNIRYTVLEKKQPAKQIIQFLEERDAKHESGIVYCLSRKKVNEVALLLQDEGYSAKGYHAGLDSETRQVIQRQFIRDEINIVVATVAFGMGIDKPNVRFVVHYDMPKNIEGYYQETGRAGRDGLSSEAFLLFGTQDIMTAKYFIESVGNEEQKRIETFKLSCMVDFAEAVTCRRSVLLNYFGESHDKKCGNCDVCLNPPTFFDAKQAAQKALSCVYRLATANGQGYGIRYVIDVLRGMDNEKIRQNQHKELTTYGIGKEFSTDEWASIIRQLIHLGYLYQDVQNYSILKLTAKAGEMLKGKVALELAKPRNKAARSGKSSAGASRPMRGVQKAQKEDLTDAELDIFEELRELRKEIANSEDKPAYQVFGDATLVEMAMKHPVTEEEMLKISGIAEVKFERYGVEFINLLESL